MRKTTMSGLAILFGAVLAVPADAQTRFASSTTDIARAEKLEAAAEALYTSPDDYRKAARLHEEAAALRPAGDLQRISNLRQAARLFYYSGAKSAARETMVKAGDAALEAGDVLTAASTYLDAAFLYREARMPAQRNELVHKARLLSNSPLLSAGDRSSILNRIQVSA